MIDSAILGAVAVILLVFVPLVLWGARAVSLLYSIVKWLTHRGRPATVEEEVN